MKSSRRSAARGRQ